MSWNPPSGSPGQPQGGYNQQQQQYGNNPQQQQYGNNQQQYSNNPPPPLPQRQTEQSTDSGFSGQKEEYERSALGANVPKAELHNPQGIIRCGDLSLTIEGNLVPVIDVLLGGGLGIFFEHHILLWKDPNVSIQFSSMGGAFRRVFAGLPIFQTEANGPGNISFSRDCVGQIVCLRLQPGQGVEVREHQFVLATRNINYSVTVFSGVANILFSQTGLLIDHFQCQGPGEGLVLLHGYGNVFERMLGPGEALDVEPGAWLWKDPSVQMQTINCAQSGGGGGGGMGGFGGLAGQFGKKGGGGFLSKLEGAVGNLVSGGGSIFMNRMVGPGRVGLQSMSFHPPSMQEGGNQRR